MSLELKAHAPDIAYSHNPIVYAWSTTNSLEYNARMVMEIVMDIGSGPELIGIIEKRPNAENLYVFNIAEILNAAVIKYDMLTVGEMNWTDPLQICTKTQRTYQIRVTEYWGDPENIDGSPDPIEKIVVKGGIQHQDFPLFHNFFEGYVKLKMPFLTWLPKSMTIHPMQPVTLFLMNHKNVAWTEIRMEFQMVFVDPVTLAGYSYTTWKTTPTVVQPGQIIIFPVDPNAADLYAIDPSKQLRKILVTAFEGETIVSETREYLIDWMDRPDQKTFAYLNSLGGIDHIRCFGKMLPKIDFTFNNAERDPELIHLDTLDTVYNPTMPLITEFNQKEWDGVKVFSGPVTYREVDCFRDFRLSPMKYEFQSLPEKRYIPIIIDQKSVNLPKTGEYPFNYDFTFKYAFQNRVYTPKYVKRTK